MLAGNPFLRRSTMRVISRLMFFGTFLVSLRAQETEIPADVDSTLPPGSDSDVATGANTEPPSGSAPFTVDQETNKLLAMGFEGFDDVLQCFLNITLVNEATNFIGSFVQKRVILCADRTYDLDFMSRIELTARTDYICGDDGQPSNNCIVENGAFHIADFYFDVEGGSSDFILLQGITFGNVIERNVLLLNSGDITFRDCQFANSFHRNSIFSGYEGDRTRLQISFFSCIWNNNQYYDNSDAVQQPMISITSGRTDVVFDNCTISGNNYELDDNDVGSVISVDQGSNLNITNTCIFDNVLDAVGVVVVQDMSGVHWENIYTNNNGASVGCSFIFNNSTKECIEADLDECPQDIDEVTPAPTPTTSSPTPESDSGDNAGTSAAVSPLCPIFFELVGLITGLLIV